MSNFLHLVGAMALLLSFAGALYTFAASGALSKLLAAQNREPAVWPAVSILKPLHGADAGLEAALESFFTLDYPAPVQLVFGVARVDDPALPIVRVLMARYPAVDAALVIDERVHGANGKISNLINMLPSASHDVLVLSDADIAVTPDYLRGVVAALSAPGVGIVTALYSGHGLSGLWSDLAAGGVNYTFLPNVAFAFTRGLARPSFGSTIALRRAVLDEIGGLAPLADHLADDYELGRAVIAAGHSLAMPPLVVRHACAEAGAAALFAHELRWARTIRTVDPAGHVGSGVTHTWALALVALALLGPDFWVFAMLALALLARYTLKLRIDGMLGESAFAAWLLPVRDVISFGVYLASLAGKTVAWRGAKLTVTPGGKMSDSTRSNL